MITVTFPDGSELSASSWEALLDAYNALEWNAGFTPEQFRQELARRAIVWVGEPVVHPTAPAALLFQELKEAGMVKFVSADGS